MLCNLSHKRQAKSKHAQLIMEARHKRQQRASFLPSATRLTSSIIAVGRLQLMPAGCYIK
jgi:hypothetical protein